MDNFEMLVSIYKNWPDENCVVGKVRADDV
jgi:hypothetical protein